MYPVSEVEFFGITDVQSAASKAFDAPISKVVDGNMVSKHCSCPKFLTLDNAVANAVLQRHESIFSAGQHVAPTQSKAGEVLYTEALPPASYLHVCEPALFRYRRWLLNGQPH